MSKKRLRQHSSKKRSGNLTPEQKRKLNPVDPEYEEWLDELDKERHSNQSTYSGKERRKFPRVKVNLEGNLSI